LENHLFLERSAMTKKDIHVVPHKDGWATKKEGTRRPGGVYEIKAEAMSAGRRQAKREGVELVEHRSDGTIVDSDSHGRDPIPPRDRNR
jgi:hypothetical protein